MSNPTISKSTILSMNIDPSDYPQSYLVVQGVCNAKWQEDTKTMYEVDEVKTMVKWSGLNVKLREGVVIPRALNFDPVLKNRKDVDGQPIPLKDELASTSKQGAVWRKTDTAVGTVIASKIFSMLPEEGSTFSKSVIRAKAQACFGVSGGPALAMGRLMKYLPKAGFKPSEPLRGFEIARGMQGMGLDPTTHVYGLPKSLMAVAGQQYPGFGESDMFVRLNAKASTGYPTQCRIDVPGALDVIMSLVDMIQTAAACEEETELKYRRIASQHALTKLDSDVPFLFLTQGKMKADVYAGDKLEKREARFYGVIPAAPKLVIMQAMQALERDKKTVASNTFEDYADGTFCATFSGMNLGPSGVKELVDCIEFQMAHRPMGFLHMGDDTWVYKHWFRSTVRAITTRFALDCSAFDLTQSEAVNKLIDEIIALMLEKYDFVAAQVYLYMTRHKRVTLLGETVAEMADASLSGFPGVSIKNGVLMHIVMERLRERLEEAEAEFVGPGGGALANRDPTWLVRHIESETARAVEDVGRGLGFTIKLEQFQAFVGELSVTDTLEVKPDLFVGYYFYAETLGGRREVRTTWDIQRALPQLKHPQFKWYKTPEVAWSVNVVRVASTLMAVCDPTEDMMPAILAGQEASLALLTRLIEEVDAGTTTDPYVVSGGLDDELAVLAEGELGLETMNYSKSLRGLSRALHNVVEKNKMLSFCRQYDLPFVRNVPAEVLEPVVVPTLSGTENVPVPIKRARKVIIPRLQKDRPLPKEKHIGRRPPVTPRHKFREKSYGGSKYAGTAQQICGLRIIEDSYEEDEEANSLYLALQYPDGYESDRTERSFASRLSEQYDSDDEARRRDEDRELKRQEEIIGLIDLLGPRRQDSRKR